MVTRIKQRNLQIINMRRIYITVLLLIALVSPCDNLPCNECVEQPGLQ
jgi:hypothetical protein